MIKLNHKELEVYKNSIKLVSEIYILTKNLPKAEQLGLTSQLRRSAVSVPSNISEGSARSSSKERRRFLEIARSSLVEMDTQIEIALTLNYLNGSEIETLSDLSNKVFAMLSRMIKN